MASDQWPDSGSTAHPFEILDRAPDAIWVARADLQIIYANAATERLFGRPRAELLGGPASAFQPASAAPDIAAALARVLDGEPHLRQGHIVRPDGTLIATEFHAARIAGGAQKDGHILVVGRDVSAWVAGRSEAREEEERLRLLVENAPDLIFTCAPDGCFVSVNRAAEGLSGYTWRQLQNMTWRDLVTEDSGAAIIAFARAAAGEQPEPFDLTVRRRDGLRARLEIRVWPLTQDGVPAGYQGIGRNVTERQEAEAAAQRSRRETEALASIAQDLTQSLEREEVLHRIVQRGRSLSESDVSAIALRDHSGFTFVADEGMRRDGLGVSITADHGLAAEALKTLRALSARRYRDHPGVQADARHSAETEGIVSVAVAPVRLDTEVVALL